MKYLTNLYGHTKPESCWRLLWDAQKGYDTHWYLQSRRGGRKIHWIRHLLSRMWRMGFEETRPKSPFSGTLRIKKGKRQASFGFEE